MKTYRTITEAKKAADKFFKNELGCPKGAAWNFTQNGNEVEFHSLDDPGMDDTFNCLVI
jgi:hypothetical protein